MEIAISDRTLWGLDWPLVVAALAAVGSIGTVVVAWVQLGAIREEARRSRRPVIELRLGGVTTYGREPLGWHVRVLPTNVGEGRATPVELGATWRRGKAESWEGRLVNDDVWNDPNLGTRTIENVRPGPPDDEASWPSIPLKGLTEHEPVDGVWAAEHTVVVTARYRDVYGDPFDLTLPLIQTFWA